MKALLLLDEINQFHWSMLKSVLLILGLLPLSQFLTHLLHNSDMTSQIMVGFLSISLFSAFTIVCFYSALNATVMQLHQQSASNLEQKIVQFYRYIPMLCLTVMLSYLAAQF